MSNERMEPYTLYGIPTKMQLHSYYMGNLDGWVPNKVKCPCGYSLSCGTNPWHPWPDDKILRFHYENCNKAKEVI